MSAGILLSFLAALLVCTLLGYLAGSFLWPRRLSKGTLWAFAPGIGAGICSLIFFLFRRPMFTVEFALFLTLAIVWALRRGYRSSTASTARQLPAASLFAAGAVGFVIFGALILVNRNPHGDWDAFAIWNSHARYLYRDGPAWQDHIQNTFHADYPLLVPSMNARAWRYLGQEVPETGGLLGLAYALSGIAVLVTTLLELRGTALAMLFGLVLLATPFYFEYGVAQSADVPLSLYLLSATALLCLYSERTSGEYGLLTLAGFMGGCAGWTKNEGLVFILGLCVALLAPVLVRPAATLRRFGAFCAGLLLPLTAIVLFKVTIAPPNDLLLNRHYPEMVEKVLNPERYSVILASFSDTLVSFGDWALNPLIPLLIFVFLSGFHRDTIRSFGWLTGASSLVLVLAAYFGVYLLTPADLQLHLDSSSQRLFLQLWPSSLLILGLALRPPLNSGTG